MEKDAGGNGKGKKQKQVAKKSQKKDGKVMKKKDGKVMKKPQVC